jgi:hypothetical protein
MNPCSYAHLIFDKGAQNVQDGEKTASSKRQPLQKILLGKLDICLQKTETRSTPVTLYKYQIKVNKGP